MIPYIELGEGPHTQLKRAQQPKKKGHPEPSLDRYKGSHPKAPRILLSGFRASGYFLLEAALRLQMAPNSATLRPEAPGPCNLKPQP